MLALAKEKPLLKLLEIVKHFAVSQTPVVTATRAQGPVDSAPPMTTSCHLLESLCHSQRSGQS